MDFRNTGRIRDLFKKIRKELIHDGDMFGIVSTGPSSIAVDMTYDVKRLDEAINKIAGSGLKPQEIIDAGRIAGAARSALSRARRVLDGVRDPANLEQVHNRRKAFIYVSNGYDFDPFSKSRAKESNERYSDDDGAATTTSSGDGSSSVDETNPFSRTDNQFAAADLASELSELTRQANRSNVTMYTIDPRGLVGGPDLDETKLDTMDWQDHIRETQSSLRVIADLTGGYRGRQLERFRQGAQADRRGNQRLLRVGLLLQQSGSAEEAAQYRDQGSKSGRISNLKYKTSYTLRPPPARQNDRPRRDSLRPFNRAASEAAFFRQRHSPLL